MKPISVTCAIILNADYKVLVTQRSAAMKLPLKMEFPGGKVEPGETPQECLIREIKEELNLEVQIRFQMQPNTHQYPDFSITLIPFVCEISSGTLQLKEHAAYQWLDKTELPGLDWAEADIPVVQQFIYLDKTMG